ncbi:ATP-grasp peptide maturase system methyltransferase [Actinomadura sp. WMMB 499]|uniref:ATP-grasp peptide maturase system methyltransferase n=1 Tax=Actinomadura sp. WMMB 499 TaxID=1219491 RepID=UPI0012460BD0|nr:ATP-grasp peptide maturase system methyltransferase [Actinomadura sp. WMMB 499]QFG23227.1 methyltransferase domain-containing protein [Actinomadura sp. WMMB 499]
MTEDERVAGLRQALADELERAGDLRSREWRRAVERVPRHLFVPEFFERTDIPDRGTLWAPVRRDDDRWLDLAYRDETWVTQLDRHLTPRDAAGPVGGDPTSSSTMPGLVVRMLEDLDVTDGASVLEIGTGTGYSTALMCERLGDGSVTSIEVDPCIAANAAAALRRAGYAPNLVVGDGLDGDAGHAPYDRIIATCSVRTIPRAWLVQARPGARVLVTVTGWLGGYGLALLEVDGDGVAEGRFLPGTISFMVARPQAAPVIGDERWGAAFEALADAEVRRAAVGPDVLRDWTGAFVAQLAVPTVVAQRMRVDGGPWVEYCLDTASGAVASLTPERGGGWTVRQAGPGRVWDDVEAAVLRWRDAGSPPQERFRIRTDGRVRSVWFDGADGPVSWASS